ncbi:MAG: transcriptional repressor [Bacteroidota bacterium]
MGIIRKTKLVEALLQHFEQHTNALSVVNLVEHFKGKANKSTVYRILDRLQDEGLVHSFRGQNGLTWYAKCSTDCSTNHHRDIHPHFQCQQCGKVECLSIKIDIPHVEARRIESAEMFLIGRCEECTS